jgi:transcriptional regulator with XRE-family HTH domain
MHCMDDATTALAVAIGSRVKRERQDRNWTLDRLAEAAGVSRRMVVNVEQGAVNPSVGTLLRLSDALGIGLPALVDLPREEQVKVTRKGEGATLWSSAAGGRGILVAGTERPDVLELWTWTLPPTAQHASEAHAPGTRELLHLHRGTLTVAVGEQTVALRAGDAMTFAGDAPHTYSNTGSGDVEFSLAVFEPAVGARTKRTPDDA